MKEFPGQAAGEGATPSVPSAELSDSELIQDFLCAPVVPTFNTSMKAWSGWNLRYYPGRFLFCFVCKHKKSSSLIQKTQSRGGKEEKWKADACSCGHSLPHVGGYIGELWTICDGESSLGTDFFRWHFMSQQPLSYSTSCIV